MTTRTVTKMIGGWELEAHTKDGWTLKDRFETTRLDLVSCQTPMENQSGNGYSSVSTYQRHEAGVIKEVSFLLEKDFDTVVREDAQARVIEDLKKDVARYKDDYDKQLAIASSATTALEHARAATTTARTEANTNLERVRALETQLAKLKTAIGEIRYKEVLGT